MVPPIFRRYFKAVWRWTALTNLLLLKVKRASFTASNQNTAMSFLFCSVQVPLVFPSQTVPCPVREISACIIICGKDCKAPLT